MTDTPNIEQAGYSLFGRWSDNEAILYNEQSGAYELWRVAAGAGERLIINTPNDGREYEHVREVSEFELDDDEVTSYGQLG